MKRSDARESPDKGEMFGGAARRPIPGPGRHLPTPLQAPANLAAHLLDHAQAQREPKIQPYRVRLQGDVGAR